MKQTLLLILVFGVAFAATLLLGRELFRKPSLSDRPEVGDLRADDAGGLAARRKADIERTMIPKDRKDVVREVPAEGAAATATTGSIEAIARTDDGLEPRGLKVTVFPAGPEATMAGGGKFLLTDLAPGSYYLGVSADGYLPRQAAEADVHAGKTCQVELWLERGFELSGRVVDDVEQRPIAGARIDFNNLTFATSDAYGNFRTPIVSERALDVITLSHDEYDRTVMVHPVIPERSGIVLAMSRGKATLDGRVIPPIGFEPAPFRVRLFTAQGEMRRERVFRDWAFEIKSIYGGPSVLEVSFPDGGLASRRVAFEAGREPVVRVDVDFSRGGIIEGSYVAPTGLVANVPIQLVNDLGQAMGEMRTDAKGRFRFAAAAEGDYAIRMDARIPPIYTEAFHVTEGKTSSITVDGATGRLR